MQEDIHDDRGLHILFWFEKGKKQEISFQWEDVIHGSGYTDPIFCVCEGERGGGREKSTREPVMSFDVLHL